MNSLGLCAEEVADIREKIRRLEEKIALKEEQEKHKFGNYRDNLEQTRHGFFDADDCFIEGRSSREERENLDNFKNMLNTRDYICVSEEEDFISKGKWFSVKFSGFEEEEKFIIVEEVDSKSTINGCISTSNPFAKCVLGKRKGEAFSYYGNNHLVEGVITKVNLSKNTHFIKEKKVAVRICRVASQYIKEEIEKDPNSFKIITPSQIKLLKEYEWRLNENISTSCLKLTINSINNILNHYKIVRESPFILDNNREVVNKRIGYGTSFSMLLFGKNKSVCKRVEMVNLAFSTETTKDYIERISPLGFHIFGLKENDSFVVPGLDISGIVYDVDNSLYEERFVTNDPLVYQKKLKRR